MSGRRARVPDTRTLAFDNDPSAGGYDRPVDPYAGQATESYPATENYPPAGGYPPPGFYPPQQPPPRPRNRLAVAGPAYGSASA